MARPFNKVPTYKLHRSTGNARCWISGRWVVLGRYNSPESLAEYARICAELAASPAAVTSPAPIVATAATINEVLLAFLRHAEQRYRGRNGKPSGEFREYKRALVPVHKLYGHTPAANFGPKALATVRDQMVRDGLARKVINQRVGRIVRAFKWATAQELVPVTVYQALLTLGGLRRGLTSAPDHAPIKPVPAADVAATLPFLNRYLRAMVELQRLTGMRPGEVCALAVSDIDATGDVWVYRPRDHKTAHHDHDRPIPLGPQARAVLADLADITAGDTSAPLFSPRRAREERFAEMRARRKSKVQPSQVSRRKKNPKVLPAERYTPKAYADAVRKAAERAGVAPWHPHQIRHLYATEVRRQFGLEATQVLLGHARADVTQISAEKNLALALKVAGEIG